MTALGRVPSLRAAPMPIRSLAERDLEAHPVRRTSQALLVLDAVAFGHSGSRRRNSGGPGWAKLRLLLPWAR